MAHLLKSEACHQQLMCPTKPTPAPWARHVHTTGVGDFKANLKLELTSARMASPRLWSWSVTWQRKGEFALAPPLFWSTVMCRALYHLCCFLSWWWTISPVLGEKLTELTKCHSGVELRIHVLYTITILTIRAKIVGQTLPTVVKHNGCKRAPMRPQIPLKL